MVEDDFDWSREGVNGLGFILKVKASLWGGGMDEGACTSGMSGASAASTPAGCGGVRSVPGSMNNRDGFVTRDWLEGLCGHSTDEHSGCF